MKLTCYIIDDEPHALDLLQDHISRTSELELTGRYTDPIAALSAIGRGPFPDLVFLDVNMPGLNGLDLAGLLPPTVTVIITTAYPEYGAGAFEKDAADLLVKPIYFERFRRSVDKALRLRPAVAITPETHILIKTGVKGQMRNLPIADIRYASAALNYLEIYLSAERVLTYLQLDELLAHLPPTQFSRIHRSHLVNHEHIKVLEVARVLLQDGKELPVGRTYREAFREKMSTALVISKRDL